MNISTVSSKGQITLPAKARRVVGIRPCDRVMIEVEDDRIVIRPIKDFMELAGFLGEAHTPLRERKDMIGAVALHVEKEQ